MKKGTLQKIIFSTFDIRANILKFRANSLQSMERFDLVVIGAGPSGYAAAMRAIDFKKKTLLIEKAKVGGAGVTNGALSSKTWWELSREASAFRKSLKRYNIKAPHVNYREIQSEVRKAVHERKSMLEEHMEELKNSNYSAYLQFAT